MRFLQSDADWALFEPSVSEMESLHGRPPRNHPCILDAVLRIARTGAPGRDPSDCSKVRKPFGMTPMPQIYRCSERLAAP